jgi:hypothetical protein
MPVDLPLSSFYSTEKSVVPSAAGTTISPSMIAELALIRKASLAIFLSRRSSRSLAGEHRGALVRDVELDAVAVELDLMNPSLARQHLVDRGRQRRRNEAGVAP